MDIKRAIYAAARRMERLGGLIQGKGYEAANARSVIVEVRALKSLVPTAGVVLDVGANKGNWTQAALKQFPLAEMHLIEPCGANVEVLNRRYQNQKNVTIHRIALSDRDGPLVLYSDTQGSGLASVNQRNLEHFGVSQSVTESVDGLSISSFCARSGLHAIDIVKLDVEGHELAVLRGADERFWRRVRAVQFEFGGCNIDSRTYFQMFWYFFKPLRYKLYRVTPLGVEEISSYRESDESFVTTNYLCVNQDPQ